MLGLTTDKRFRCPGRTSPALAIQICLCVFLFFWLAGNGLQEFFTGDDLMNLYKYFEQPPSHWLAGVARFWSSAYYRPLGGLVYLTLYSLFGFHALPFKIFLFALLLFNLVLTFQLAKRLTQSAQAAVWVLLLCSYHAALNGLYLNFGTIYDVLAYSFFIGALLAHIRWETRERSLLTAIVVLACYILGLCSKEIVVTLPAVLLAYSVFFGKTIRQERWHWPVRSGLPVLSCLVLAVVYTVGKTSGPVSLVTQSLYKPHFTLHQYAWITAHYVHEFFYLPERLPTPTAVLWILGLMLLASLALRSRLMLFCAISIIVTQLPVSFIAPRGAFALYVSFTFWSLYAVGLIDAVLPLFRHPLWSFLAFLAVAALLVPMHLRMKPIYDADYVRQTHVFRRFAEQLDNWHFRLPAEGRVLLVNDPFPSHWSGYDPLFFISLRAHTTSAAVHRLKFTGSFVQPSELASYDYVIDYDTDWRLLKAPGQPLLDNGRLEELRKRAPVVLVDGFEPLKREGQRPVHAEFAMRIQCTEPGVQLLEVFFITFEPMIIAAQLDHGETVEHTVAGSGDYTITLPIRSAAKGELHDLRFHTRRAGGAAGTPTLLLVSASLRPA